MNTNFKQSTMTLFNLQLDRLNATVTKIVNGKSKGGSNSEFDHQISTLKKDFEALQQSSAKAEGTFSSTQQMVLKTLSALKKDVDALKLEALNPVSMCIIKDVHYHRF